VCYSAVDWHPFALFKGFLTGVRDVGLAGEEGWHPFALFKGFLTGVRDVGLAGEEGGGIGGKLPPSMLKKP